MYEVSTRRCARLSIEVRWINTTMSNLPTFDGLNPLETFLPDFETSVPTQQQFLAMDEALKATPTRCEEPTKEILQTRYNVEL
jgi:hypothetical protein